MGLVFVVVVGFFLFLFVFFFFLGGGVFVCLFVWYLNKCRSCTIVMNSQKHFYCECGVTVIFEKKDSIKLKVAAFLSVCYSVRKCAAS